MKRKILVFFIVAAVIMQSSGAFVFGQDLLEPTYNGDLPEEFGSVTSTDESLDGGFEENYSDTNMPQITLDEPLINDNNEQQNISVDIIESNSEAVQIEMIENNKIDDAIELPSLDESSCVENEDLIDTAVELPEEIINATDLGEITESKLDDETNEIVLSEPLVFNRENIIEDDLFGDIIVEIESGNYENIGSISINSNANFINSNEMMTVDESVYSTAPVINNLTSLRAEEPGGMRFCAVVTPEQRYAAVEYGFLTASTKALQDNNLELTFDITEITFLSGIGYSITENIDKVFYIDENGNYVYSMVLLNIPETAFLKDVTARPYIIYNIDGVETLVYGDTYSNNAYRTAKTELVASNDDAVLEYAQTIIDSVENSSLYLESATEVYLSENVDGCVGENPDIDVVSFVPEESGFYTITFTSGLPCEYEVLDEFGNTFTFVKTGNNPTNVAYLFEKNEIYYVRIKGAPETEYSFWFTPCMEGALIYDFADGAEGFTCGDGATGTAEDGKLKVSIDKSISLTKAFMENDNLSIDLFDYSRLIIRMKNTTNTTTLSGTVRIDLEYDGSGINYSLDSAMPANMTSFENVEFDFTTRYGNVSSLKFSFGQILSSLSGDIYIDSIAILPMPEVLAWDFDEDIDGWSYTELINSAEIEDGAWVLNMSESTSTLAPAIISPGTSAYDFDKYNIIKIRIKNETASNNMHVYFSTLADGHSSLAENKKFVVDIEPFSSNWITYTIDLSEHSLFEDSLKDLMISIPAEGTVYVDYIRLYKKEIPYEDVVWSFDNDLEGFTSNNERHTLSLNDGTMVVETQEAAWGAFLTPDELELPTSEYRYLVLGVNSATVSSNLEAYFKTSTNPSYAENDHVGKVIHKHILPINKSTTFKEYVIDLSSVPEGYTTGYTGNLKQFMLALPAVGTYEIDYIKLTNVYEKNEDDEVGNIYKFTVTENAEYNIIISKQNNTEIGTYSIEFDPNKLELVDACAMTYLFETEVGQVIGTDISITSIGNGTITFVVSDKTAAGVVNCLKFKGIESGIARISIETDIE